MSHTNTATITRQPAPRAPARAETLAGLAFASGTRPGAALRHKDHGRWTDTSYEELAATVRQIATGLMALGIERGDRVAILSNTRPEWTLADLGALAVGATVAPIYQTGSPGEVQYVLAHSEARLVFCEDEEQLLKVAEIRDRCPELEHIVAFEGGIDGSISLSELRSRSTSVSQEALDERIESTSPHDVAAFVYTSGTTGPPKACMLTHANFLATMRMYEEQLDLRDAVVFMFLPLAHALARVTQMVTLEVGGTIAYWERDSSRLLDNLAEVAPTHFPSVPRVFEKIYTKATAGIEEATGVKGPLARWALATGRKARRLESDGRRPGPIFDARLKVADKLVLSKVRALFGGELRLALTGAAPIARDVLEFFDACGIRVLEGYGMTESCAAATLNTVADLRYGTVGRPLPGTEVKTAADGEILLSGPHVFAGYFKDPGATRDTIVDGWLRTGDIGRVDPDGFVSITGRKKDIIITSSGKNITPSNIENALKESRWISEAVVYGDGRPYLVALITLDPDEAPALAEKLGVDPQVASMARDERVREEIQHEVDSVNERFARIEQVKRFVILDRDLSQADGELTPTLKVKRGVVYDRYADRLAELYR